MNALGNYPGKRTPKPIPPALTAKERFNRLQAMYLTYRRPYRFLSN
jgi:hypothetical protein